MTERFIAWLPAGRGPEQLYHRASRPAVQCFVRWLQQAIAKDQTCGAAAACGPGVDDFAS